MENVSKNFAKKKRKVKKPETYLLMIFASIYFLQESAVHAVPAVMQYSEDLSKLSKDSYDAIFGPLKSKDQAARNNKHDYTARSSRVTDEERPYSIRSSIDVPDVTRDSVLMSQRERPPLQAMDRSSRAYVHEKSSSSVFTANSTPQEWSLASNESLFSLQEDHVSYDNGDLAMGLKYSSQESSEFSLSEEVMSDRPSTQPGTARSVFDGDVEEAGSPISDNSSREFIVQKTHDLNEEKACIPEVHRGSRKPKGKILPLRSL